MLTNSCFKRDCSARSKVASEDAVSPLTSPSVCSCHMLWLRWWQIAFTCQKHQQSKGAAMHSVCRNFLSFDSRTTSQLRGYSDDSSRDVG